MFAFKSQKEIVVRILLIVTILFNALALNPVTAKAEQSPKPQTISKAPELKMENRSIPTFARPEPRVGNSPTGDASTDLTNNSQNNNSTDPALLFIENMGQFDMRARFQVRGGEATLYLADDAIWFTYVEPDKQDPSADQSNGAANQKPKSRKAVNLKVDFPGSNNHAQLIPFGVVNSHLSYLNGTSSASNFKDVPVYQGVRYADFYPGMDLELTSLGNQLTWRFVLTDPIRFYAKNNVVANQGIRVKVAGYKAIALNQDNMQVSTDIGQFTLPTLQFRGKQKIAPLLNGNELQITVPDQNSLQTEPALVPDTSGQGGTKSLYALSAQAESNPGLPMFSTNDQLVYSSYLNAGWGHGIALGTDGSIYVTGGSVSPNFPIVPGNSTLTSGSGFVAKINPVSGTLIYSAILSTDGNSIAVDSNGNAYMVGWGSTGYIAKINPTGTGLVYEKDLGVGEATGVAVDANGSAYVVGNSANDVYVTKVISEDIQEYTSFLGVGSGAKSYGGIALMADGSVFLTGEKNGGSAPDAFIIKLDSTGNISYSTTLEGEFTERGRGIAVDHGGNAYITGQTSSLDFSAMNTFGTTLGGRDMDAYIVKLNPLGGVIYSDRIGGQNWDIGEAISVDSQGQVYVVGWTQERGFPTLPSAFQRIGNYDPNNTTQNPSSYGDKFVVKLDSTGQRLYYSTYVGGREYEWYNHSVQAPIDSQGNIYFTGATRSTDFPITSGTMGRNSDLTSGFVSVINTNLPIIPYDESCSIFGLYGCVQESAGGPINTRTGAYDYFFQDISIPTTAGDLSFNRTYNTTNISASTSMSAGWSHNHDIKLIFSNDPGGEAGKILLKDATSLLPFYDMGNGIYKGHPGTTAALVVNPGSPVTYKVTTSAQEIYTFDTTGRLQSRADSQNHSWTYTYNASNQVTQIDANGGAAYLHFTYVQSRLDSITDQTGRGVSYIYDAVTGDLDQFTDTLHQQWTYTYVDPAYPHYLTEVKAPDTTTVERTEFDTQGRAVRQYDGSGKQTVTLTFNTDNSTTVTDALGHTETHTYDERGTIIAQKNNSVNAESGKQYDLNFRPGVVSDSLGNATNLAWSNDGNNLTQIKDALQNSTSISYGPLNNPASIIDPLSHETKYFYTDTNFPTLPTRIEYPLSFDNGVTYIGIDYEYYPPASGAFAGKVKFVTDALGSKTYYEYNSAGQTTKVTSGFGTPNALDSTYVYNSLGCLTDTTDSQNVGTHNEYDAAGRLTKTIHNVTPDNFDPDDFIQNLVVEENIYNIVTEYRYDIRGNQIAVIDTYGVITRTYYDLNNRPVTIVQNLYVNGTPADVDTPIGSIPPFDSAYPDRNIVTKTEYDDAGNVIVTRDPAEGITRTYYDEANRPKLVIQNWAGVDLYGDILTAPAYVSDYPDQNIRTEYFYDANRNVIATKDTLGIYTRTYYDELNRPMAVIQNLNVDGTPDDNDINTLLGDVPAYTSVYPDRNLRTNTYYDKNGNIIATQDPKENFTRTYYDALNRPVAVVQNLVGKSYTDSTLPDPEQGECGTDANICSFTYYDEAGNVIATVDPRGVVTRTYYDSANRPYATVQNLVGQDIYLNTPPDRTSGGPDENIRTDIVYDAFGRRDTTTDPLEHATKYEYNEIGQLAKVTGNYVNGLLQNASNERNIVTAYEYDALGRQVKVTDTLNRVTLSGYDDLGRLTTSTQNYDTTYPQNYKDSTTGNQYNLKTSFTYDVRGNQIAVTVVKDTNEIVTRTYYDDLGRPVTVVRNFTGNINDPAAPERGTPPSSTSNLRTDTIYLGNGNVDYVLDEMGEQTDYTYDALGRMTTILDPLLKSTNYEYDANGNRTLLTDAQEIATRYEYDNLNRLKAVVENYVPSSNPDVETNVRTEYTYDAGGNRLSIRDGNSFLEVLDYRTVFTYDDLGRLKTETDAESHEWLFSYDKLGNRISVRDAKLQEIIYGYDTLNRLKLINYPAPDADVSFNYDALGRRLNMTDGTGITYWTYTNLDQPSLITDPFGIGVSYGYDSLGNRTSLSYGSQSYDYHYNDLNRLDRVTGSGLPTQTLYQYDAAGRLKTVTRPNDVITSYTYYDNGWLQDIAHTAGATTLSAYQYQYYNNGNRSQSIENVNAPAIPPTPTFTPTYTNTPTDTPTSTPTNTATATFTPTDTSTPTFTPTPTATQTPSSSMTGWISPAANTTSSGGDGNGFQTNPNNAYSDNATFAVDTNSGSNTNTTCSNAGKDRHVFYSYDLASIPNGSTILGIEVRLDMMVDATAGTPKSCIELSWDGGTTWTAYKTSTTFTTTEASYILGGVSDNWNRTWSTSELSNLRVRITNVASNTSRDFSLDWIPVRISYNPPTATATFTDTPTQTPTHTATQTPTITLTPTHTNTLTASPTGSGLFPTTEILDNFNRANGSIGSNWSGNTSAFAINTNQLDAGSNGAAGGIYWNAASFGADQEAYVTFSQVDTDGEEQDLLLKSQSSTTWGDGVIEVWYDAPNHRVRVYTYEFPNWVSYGADIPVTFANGDTFGARAKADGTVEVYKNGEFLASRDITSWSHYADGGYIGIWFIGAGDALLDNFGGGDLPGGESLLMDDFSSPLSTSTPTVHSFSLTSPDSSPFWQGLTLGASQSSQVTFTNVNGTIGKPRSNGVWDDNTLQALYDVPNNRIQLWQYNSQQGWKQNGTDIPVTFANGDIFSARALANGTVEIRKNGILLMSRTSTFARLSQPVAAFKPVSFILPSLNLSPLQQSSPVTINYVYDDLNRVKEANYSNGNYYHYTYDAVGNRMSQTTKIGATIIITNYNYDHANRLTDVGGMLYIYDANGNLTSDGVNTFTYDSANRLKTMTGASVTATYSYNGLGDRLQETVNGVTTTFTMDLNTGLTQALSDGTNHYVYGLGRIAQVNIGTEYFLGDALGSVRQLTDASGAITYSRAYDPYGVVTSTTGTSSTTYGYTGEVYGDSTELLYLRARYYTSNTGRFLTRDMWGGDANLPISYNKWIYAYNQPLNYLDSSGLSPDKTSLFAIYKDVYDPKTNKNAPHWSQQSMTAIDSALAGIAIDYANAYNQNILDRNNICPPNIEGLYGTSTKIDPFTAFYKIHGGKITITWVDYLSPEQAWGYGGWSNQIRIYKDAPLGRMSREFDSGYPFDLYSGGRLGRFITHEMGHVFENAYKNAYGIQPGRTMVAKTPSINNRDGFAGKWLEWQWSSSNESHEIFADMFVGWVYDNWMKKPENEKLLPQYYAGVAKSTSMNKNMPIWITDIILKSQGK